ncbi:uncharacterized protein CG45076 isoform X4 [Tribolium castaneum]|uniref:uncharacterized protein CG45076 isoform X4 n=1 Tax=Tribolium castaneum TaxID=7070 RepID=UPI0000D57725|nr:PREDICTED: protein anoxia up-regulated isoform X4 [Tribolium castaneum]|eukprot:XP_008200166.1 PREDICTED: protein anoxia up-regulated isoform X4 [Tribolium castaneum]
MVYESDFYTTRRPYRPSYSTYSVSSAPSRQVRILPGLGKVHVVHTYDRIVPYVGHKRLTVVTLPPKIYSTRSSVLQREYDWIENKVRPWVAYSPTNRYLNSDSAVRYVYVRNPITGLKYHSDYYPSRYYNFYRIIRPLSYYDDYWPFYRPLSAYYSYWPISRSVSYLDDIPLYRSLRLQSIFDDETRLIRAQTASLLKQVHQPVPRIRTWPITPLNRFGDFPSLPMKYSNDTYIHRLLTYSPNHKIQYATYYTEPVKKYIGAGHLSCVSYAGDKGYSRRRPLTMFEDALRNDIQLLSYYITKFRDEKQQPKEIKAPLSPARPSRIFSVHKPMEDPVAQEIKDLREARAQRLAKIYASDDKTTDEVEKSLKEKKRKEEARLAEERAIAEEQAKKEAEAARKAEIARQEQLAAQLAAERAAELERQAEQARQEELAKQAEIERMKREEEERARLEEQRRLEEEAKAEEERQQLLRLEEIARQAEEEKERELARQAEELAELARQEAERAEQERLEREQKEKEQKEAELAELARQETELAELERQEKELAELAAKAQEELAANEEEEEKTEEQAEPVVDEPEAEAQEEEPAEVEPEDEPEAEAEADE